MKRFRLLVLGLCLIVASSSGVWAQGFFGSSTPGAGLLSSMFPSGCFGADCGNPCGSGAPTVYVGWLEHPKGSVWTMDRAGLIGTASWPLKGLWLGASQDVPVSCGLGLTVSGGIFLPDRMTGAWTQSPRVLRPFSLTVRSYDWWYVDAMLRQSACGPFEVLLGFRWDHTSERNEYDDDSVDDHILNSFIPLFGCQLKQTFGAGALTVRAVGSPILWGSLKYHYWEGNGYSEQADFTHNSKSDFLEVFTDYKLRVTNSVCAGVFGKWNSHRVRTGYRNLTGAATDPVSASVDIRAWTVGGEVSVAFASPW